MKVYYVTFDKDGGWVTKGQPPMEAHLVNPDLSKVRGLPPESWRLVDGQVCPAQGEAPVERVKTATPATISNTKGLILNKRDLILIAVSVLLSLLLGRFL
jgi:hypothetical protein